MFGLDYEKSYIQFAENKKHELFADLAVIEEMFDAEKIIFRNTDFPLYPKILIANSKLITLAQYYSEAMIPILEKVIDIYKKDTLTQKYFMLTELQHDLVNIDPGYPFNICVSRFDTFLTGDGTPFKILENNTDCPAGVIFTGRIMNLMQKVSSLRDYLNSLPAVHKQKLEVSSTFAEALLTAYSYFNKKKNPTVGILQLRGKASPETQEMLKIFSEMGMQSIIVDPRDLSYKSSALAANGVKLDLIWNKINTTYFNPLINEYKSEIAPFIRACQDQSICHINSFAARYITESKLCMAYLANPKFHSHFDKQEIDIIKRVLPWAHKLEDGIASYKGMNLEIKKIALEYKNDLVLKAAYDIRGDGVVIGKSVSQNEWQDLIDAAWDKAYILQEYVRPPETLVPTKDKMKLASKKFSFDMFMFNKKLQGFGSKLSDSDKLNIFQGGSKMAIFALQSL